jgi:mRNA interferase MazF
MQRGEVCIARLNPNQGSEIGKVRPVLILTENRLLNAGISMVMVVPLSSQYWKGMEALRVEVTPRDRLLKPSYLVIEQARSIDRARMSDEVLARLTCAELQLVEKQLRYLLGFS